MCASVSGMDTGQQALPAGLADQPPGPVDRVGAGSVGVGCVGDGFAVTLDGRSPRTPGQKPVVVPQRALAEVMATEGIQ